MKATERFLNYVKIYTTSDPQSKTVPSSARQFALARLLADEMEALGISDVTGTDNCYVYGNIPATPGCENIPAIGFIAHLDTSPDFAGQNVNPQVIPDYDGGEIRLGESGRILSPAQFPHLPSLKGRTLISTDGATLLGADDKAGVSEILTACERILAKNSPHGKICVAFTPDEEIGRGADHFDFERFGAEFAYTLDGGEEGEINFENFNASEAMFEINGFNVHPGSAKNVMRNASLVAFEINAMLPGAETPRDTEDYEGFFHLCDITGNVEKAQLRYIIRDHSAAAYEVRKSTLRHIEKILNERHGEGTVSLTIREQYANMEEIIRKNFHLIETAKAAMAEIGLTPIVRPIRGGTDGARLSFDGLPCPNLCTGGYAWHGPYEHITAEGLEACTQLIEAIVRQYAAE